MTTIKEIALKRHTEAMKDPVYQQGYSANNHWEAPYEKNPYRFANKTGIAQTRLAAKDGPLTEREKKQLKRLGEKMDKTKWSRWSKGNYYRWITEKGEN